MDKNQKLKDEYALTRTFFMDNLESLPAQYDMGHEIYANLVGTSQTYMRLLDKAVKEDSRLLFRNASCIAYVGNLQRMQKHLEENYF